MNFQTLFIRLFIHCPCLIFIFQTSCSEPLYWAKPNAEQGEFERDLATCRQRTNAIEKHAGPLGLANISASFGTESAAVEQCLAEKGWFLARKPND